MVESDPLRALSRSPARARVGAYELNLPWQPAVEWIEILRHGPDMLAVALCDDPDGCALDLATGALPFSAVQSASHTLLEAECGKRWWVALKLAYTSATPAVLGELTLCGVDPSRVGFGQWCAAVYRILTRNADAKERMKTDFELELPPDGYESAWDDGNDFAALNELARQYEN
jgi:hypothetical protein